MGNCVFKGFAEVEEMVKVVTSNGGIMELYSPITAECITNEFPGHGLFRTPDYSSSPPLLHNEELHAGELYYLLPLITKNSTTRATKNALQDGTKYNRTSNVPSATPAVATNNPSLTRTPYRMSFDNQGLSKRSEAEVFPRNNSMGVWKVRLVISPEQLSDILSQEARTEALIESVRTVAKCGSGVHSTANSDQWSSSSSWKASSNNCDVHT